MKVLIVVLLVILVAALAFAVSASSRRRRTALRKRFGPEYDRTVSQTGSERKADAELAAREQHRASYEVHPLPEAARQRYLTAWTRVQTGFVDAPDTAVRDADRLVSEVLTERGYPTEDHDRLAGDLSVDHAGVLDHFRAAHHVYLRNERQEATTEDLRRAMQHYRTLMEELVSS